jgi:preprotein translocase subunit YajC
MSSSLSDSIIFFVPLLILVGIWFAILRRQQSNTKKILALNDKTIEQNGEMIGVLRDIKVTLENRNP